MDFLNSTCERSSKCKIYNFVVLSMYVDRHESVLLVIRQISLYRVVGFTMTTFRWEVLEVTGFQLSKVRRLILSTYSRFKLFFIWLFTNCICVFCPKYIFAHTTYYTNKLVVGFSHLFRSYILLLLIFFLGIFIFFLYGYWLVFMA